MSRTTGPKIRWKRFASNRNGGASAIIYKKNAWNRIDIGPCAWYNKTNRCRKTSLLAFIQTAIVMVRRDWEARGGKETVS